MTALRLLNAAESLYELTKRLERGIDFWYNNSDESERAGCDPSDHYMLEQEIENKKKEIIDIVKEWNL